MDGQHTHKKKEKDIIVVVWKVMPSSSREEGKKSRLKIIIYGGFGGESGDDAVRAQLEQMAHPTDFGVRAHLHAFLAVLQRLAVEKDVAQMENCARCDREKQEQQSYDYDY